MSKETTDNQPIKRKRGRPKKDPNTPPKSKPKHYIDNNELERLIREYYRTDVFSEELGEMIHKISEHITYMPRFIQYTYHDSMISDSNYKIVKALNERKYDPDRGSAFSYFTRICINAFFFVTEKERKGNIGTEHYQDVMYDELELNGYVVDEHDTEDHTWE